MDCFTKISLFQAFAYKAGFEDLLKIPPDWIPVVFVVFGVAVVFTFAILVGLIIGIRRELAAQSRLVFLALLNSLLAVPFSFPRSLFSVSILLSTITLLIYSNFGFYWNFHVIKHFWLSSLLREYYQLTLPIQFCC